MPPGVRFSGTSLLYQVRGRESPYRSFGLPASARSILSDGLPFFWLFFFLRLLTRYTPPRALLSPFLALAYGTGTFSSSFFRPSPTTFSLRFPFPPCPQEEAYPAPSEPFSRSGKIFDPFTPLQWTFGSFSYFPLAPTSFFLLRSWFPLYADLSAFRMVPLFPLPRALCPAPVVPPWWFHDRSF